MKKILFPLIVATLLSPNTLFAHGAEKHDKNINIKEVLEKQKKVENNNREIEVEFAAIVKNGLDVEFKPVTKKVKIKLGEKKQVFYKFKNNEGRDLKILATHSIDPIAQSSKFKKLVCFCFENQTLAKGADIELPVLFNIEADLPKDVKKMKILYTLYEVKAPLKDSELSFEKDHEKKQSQKM